jgi:hypothetical protein
VTVEDKFNAFHAANPRVYGLFKRFAAEAIRAGVRRLSSKLLIERIRWECTISTTGAGWSTTKGKPFKIDNRHTFWYARKFMSDYPGAAELFETRVIKTP